MSFDTKCYELAKDFLDDMPNHKTEADRNSLAQSIQNAIEDWIQSNIPVEDRP